MHIHQPFPGSWSLTSMCLQPPVLLTLSGFCRNDSWNHQWQKPQPTAKGLTVSVDAHARELNVQPWNSNSWWINHDYNCSRVVSDWFGTMADTKLIWHCSWITVYHGHSIFHSWWVVSKVLSQIPNLGNFATGLKMYRCIIVMRLQGLSDYYFYIVTTDFSFPFCAVASNQSSDERFNCLEQKFRLCMTMSVKKWWSLLRCVDYRGLFCMWVKLRLLVPPN